MEDHPLLDIVTKWPGRRPTQAAFEALGFSLHRARQDELIQFCGTECSDLLYRYWDEVALETMQSLGQGNPDGRTFVIMPKIVPPCWTNSSPPEILSSRHSSPRHS
ncbi:hypothetical protein [Bradyrhizobium ottawaense]|uniref:hypothetical protein n=1 Tax=Bradyrhizobium ottawaense TaxID=931866 RepID=UPI001BABE23E|nr:hypothetical protein [Bradyrhizobium ottawaense]MBR1361748.1 hypothetical protein [Bradyrhizobium ottawaense]